MKPTTMDAATVQSNISADNTGQFTVDQDSLAHIMSVLTNLYADPELAVIREYLTNAYDSHVEAAELDPHYVKVPVEVTTPSHFQKSYIIKDYGIGMSKDDLKNIYSKYGASTKRNSNTVVGMLGLGSKSALTYTNSFTITAVKNGQRTMAIVSINEDGVPVFHIVDERDTSKDKDGNPVTPQRNGVEINIPVKDRNTFAAKTQNFVKYWPDGIITVDGAEPVKHGFEFISQQVINDDKQEADVYLAPTTGTGYYADTPKSYVVMGNVPYEIDAEYVPSDLSALRCGFVAYVPIGSVTITPSREKLYYNTNTKAVINKIGNGLAASVIQNKMDEIESAPTHQAAFFIITDLSYEMRSTTFFNRGVSYRGDVMPSQINHNYKRVSWNYNDKSDEYGYDRFSLSTVMSQSDEHQVIFVTDSEVDFTKHKVISSVMRRKARYWAKSNGYHQREIMFIQDDVDSDWVAHVPRVTWKTIEALKIPRNPGVVRPTAVPYDFYRYQAHQPAQYNRKGTVLTVNEVRAHVAFDSELVSTSKRKTYYISPADMQEDRWRSGTTPQELLNRFQDPNIELVVMGTNRFEKFLRSHPNAEHIRVYATKFVADKAKAISDIHLVVEAFQDSEEEFCKVADHQMIDDPELANFIKEYNANHDADAMRRLIELTAYLRRANLSISIPESTTDREPFADYPLVRYIGGDYVEHLYTYLNATFANK